MDEVSVDFAQGLAGRCRVVFAWSTTLSAALVCWRTVVGRTFCGCPHLSHLIEIEIYNLESDLCFGLCLCLGLLGGGI